MPTVSVVDAAGLGEISERLEPPGVGLQIAEHGLAGEELQAQLLGPHLKREDANGLCSSTAPWRVMSRASEALPIPGFPARM
jgi:hypothetical protein